MNRRLQGLMAGEVTRHVFPFFWLRGEDEQTLRHYMRAIRGANCRAACLESRPHPDFCGPGWWRDLDILIDEAKKLDMKLWILDDAHFPTGYCNGALRARMEAGEYELLRQSVTYKILGECREGDAFGVDREALSSAGEGVRTRADE